MILEDVEKHSITKEIPFVSLRNSKNDFFFDNLNQKINRREKPSDLSIPVCIIIVFL